MIVHPRNWTDVGKPISIEKIEAMIMTVLNSINCNCLALSGGLDSSLTLYYLSKLHVNIFAFTIGFSDSHPDVRYAELMVSKFPNVEHKVYIPTPVEIMNKSDYKDQDGDHAVRLFYKFVKKYTDGIITCDGSDEYMCGYYTHQEDPGQAAYYRHLRELQKCHLEPLNKNSKDVKVYLPYIDSRLTRLLSQVPISEKVDRYNRKKLMVRLAKGKIPKVIMDRRKYGFCDALRVKE